MRLSTARRALNSGVMRLPVPADAIELCGLKAAAEAPLSASLLPYSARLALKGRVSAQKKSTTPDFVGLPRPKRWEESWLELTLPIHSDASFQEKYLAPYNSGKYFSTRAPFNSRD